MTTDRAEYYSNKSFADMVDLLEIAGEALLAQGYTDSVLGQWHTAACHEYARDNCLDECNAARDALKRLGLLPGVDNAPSK